MSTEQIRTIPMISFNEYAYAEVETKGAVLINMDTVPVPLKHDYWKRNANVEKGLQLCAGCDGTGNDFMCMHHTCDTCKGTGRCNSST
jgi:hypothetical protein